MRRTFAGFIVAIFLWGSLAFSAFAFPTITEWSTISVSPSDKDVFPRQGLIKEAKAFTKKYGFKETKNFLTYEEKLEAFYACFSIGKFELPSSYMGLEYFDGTKDGCGLDPKKVDFFFYPSQAVANIGGTPLTKSLSEASTERLLEAIFHEEFHEQVNPRMPRIMNESAATLIGYLMAGEFAREKFGENSIEYKNLKEYPSLYLDKAMSVGVYHETLVRTYLALKEKRISQEMALRIKRKVFREINSWVTNNAELAYEATYTGYYVLLYQVYLVHGENLQFLFDTIKKVSDSGMTEEEAEKYLRSLL